MRSLSPSSAPTPVLACGGPDLDSIRFIPSHRLYKDKGPSNEYAREARGHMAPRTLRFYER